MDIQVSQMSPGEVKDNTGKSDVSWYGEMAIQIGERSPGEVRWPFR